MKLIFIGTRTPRLSRQSRPRNIISRFPSFIHFRVRSSFPSVASSVCPIPDVLVNQLGILKFDNEDDFIISIAFAGFPEFLISKRASFLYCS